MSYFANNMDEFLYHYSLLCRLEPDTNVTFSAEHIIITVGEHQLSLWEDTEMEYETDLVVKHPGYIEVSIKLVDGSSLGT